MNLDEIKALKRKNRELTKTLREHTALTTKVIAAMDALMALPDSVERGRKIGRVIHALEFTNDSARHFALGEDFPLKR